MVLFRENELSRMPINCSRRSIAAGSLFIDGWNPQGGHEFDPIHKGIDASGRRAELGYGIVDEARGRGFPIMCSPVLIIFGLEALNVEKIICR